MRILALLLLCSPVFVTTNKTKHKKPKPTYSLAIIEADLKENNLSSSFAWYDQVKKTGYLATQYAILQRILKIIEPARIQGPELKKLESVIAEYQKNVAEQAADPYVQMLNLDLWEDQALVKKWQPYLSRAIQ